MRHLFVVLTVAALLAASPAAAQALTVKDVVATICTPILQSQNSVWTLNAMDKAAERIGFRPTPNSQQESELVQVSTWASQGYHVYLATSSFGVKCLVTPPAAVSMAELDRTFPPLLNSWEKIPAEGQERLYRRPGAGRQVFYFAFGAEASGRAYVSIRASY